jgi:hypothetical protein
MAQMLPSDIIPMLAVFSLAVILSSVYVGGINDAYDMTIDTGWEDTYDSLDTAASLSEDIEDATNTDQQGLIPDAIELMWTGTINVIKLVFNSLFTFSEIVSNVLEDLGVDDSVANPVGIAINAILVGMIVFAVVSSVLKRNL